VSSKRRIAEARGGCRSALDRLIGACSPYLLAVANQEFSAALRSRLDPVDVVQDTLMKAWQHFSHFRGETESDLFAWLRQILRRNLASERRKHVQAAVRSIRREVPLAKVASVQLPAFTDSGAEAPDTQAQARERHKALESALRLLPQHYRQALHLHTQAGLTYSQVGERLHCSSEAARKLWERAAEELARLLGDVWKS
jgi:RNA polymerase sigma-70 factor (subfamily 1)